MMVTQQQQHLVKWIVQTLNMDDKGNRFVLYSEVELSMQDCCDLSKDQKQKVIQAKYDQFFKSAGKIYSDITKRWMKIGNVDVFYKDLFGDEIAINNEVAFYYFLRNVEEVLKAPIEIIIKDFTEEPTLNLDMQILKNICDSCGAVKTCHSCDRAPIANPETPISITSDLEKTLKIETEQNVKLWRPEEDFEVENDHELDQKPMKTEIPDDNNNNSAPNPLEIVKAETVTPEVKPQVPPKAAPNPVIIIPKVPPRANPRPTTPAPLLTFEKTLTINEQVVEEPKNSLEPYKVIDRKAAADLPKLKMNDMLLGNYRVKPGYCDLDNPSPDEELSFDAVNWSAAKERARLLQMSAEPPKMVKKEPKIEKNGERKEQKPQEAEMTSAQLLKLKRKIPLPRPLHSSVKI